MIRDQNIRKRIRKILIDNNIDSFNFTYNQIKELNRKGLFKQNNGIPIKKVKIFIKISRTAEISTINRDNSTRRKKVYTTTKKYAKTGNNRYIPIYKDIKSNKLIIGQSVSVMDHLNKIHSRQIENTRLVKRLSEGCTMKIKGKWYVVRKLSGKRAELALHDDARDSRKRKQFVLKVDKEGNLSV